MPTRRRRTDAKIEDETHESWTLLYDGALPAVCDAMEKPRDSHYKFHASAALKASLQRASAIATAEVADATATASVVMSDKLSDRVLGILWANWEDPLSQTVKEVQAAFEHLLDVKSIFDRRRANANANANTKTPHDDAFLIAATRQLLNKGAHCKGRYVPLSVATRRLGARRLLAVAPELLAETLDAMRDDSVSCAAGTLVAALSAKLLEEMEEEEERAANGGGGDDDDASASASATAPEGDSKKRKNEKTKKKLGGTTRGPMGGGPDVVCFGRGGGKAVTAWRAWWVPPLLKTMLGEGRARVGAVTYALPPLLKRDGASIVPLLKHLVDEKPPRGLNESDDAAWSERRSGALVALLRAARARALLDPACVARVSPVVFAAGGYDGPSFEVPRELLERAVVCRDARTRCDALELVCLDGRTASLPGDLELDLLKSALPGCLRGDSAAFRNALGSMLRGLLARVKTGQLRAAVMIRQISRRRAVFGDEKPPDDVRYGGKGAAAFTPEEADAFILRAVACEKWTKWLVRALLASAYPGAPYERKFTALDLLNAVVETWGVAEGGEDRAQHERSESTKRAMEKAAAGDPAAELAARALEASPYLPCLREDCTTSLLGAAVDSWDKLRASAFSLLQRHPAPLAGAETPTALESRLRWALKLLRSPRARESDAAAQLTRLLFRKYALDLGWDVKLAPVPSATTPAEGATRASAGATATRVLGALLFSVRFVSVRFGWVGFGSFLLSVATFRPVMCANIFSNMC